MRALIPQLPQLLLGQPAEPLTNLASLAPRVLPTVPEPHQRVDEHAQADHAEGDAVAAEVARRVGGGVDEGGHDARGVADGELEAGSRCAFSVSGGVCWELWGEGRC